MSGLWTPGGDESGPAQSRETASGEEPSPEEMAQAIADMRSRMIEVPAAIVVRDYAATFYELAYLHLARTPPDVDEARVAIDAMAGLLDALNGRIPDEEALREALAELRLNFVQVKQAVDDGAEAVTFSGPSEEDPSGD